MAKAGENWLIKMADELKKVDQSGEIDIGQYLAVISTVLAPEARVVQQRF